MFSDSPPQEVSQEGLSWSWTLLPWGRGYAVEVQLFLLPSSLNPSLDFIFASVTCWNISPRLQDSHKGFFLIHGWLFKLVFSEGSQLQLWGPRARSWASSGSSAGTEVSVPFTWHMSGWDSYWIHRHNMLGHTSPHKGTFVHGWSSVVERGPPWRMSYSIILLMSLEAAPKDAAWRRKRSRGPGILFLPCFNLLPGPPADKKQLEIGFLHFSAIQGRAEEAHKMDLRANSSGITINISHHYW